MKSTDRFTAGTAALALAASTLGAACGEEPKKKEFPEGEPCAGVRVVCADAQSIQTGSVEVTGIIEGAADCHKKGWAVKVGAAPANVMYQRNDGGLRTIPDVGVHGLLPEGSTRVTPVTQDGSHTLTVENGSGGSGNKYLFVAERYAPAVVMACDCVNGHRDAADETQHEFAARYCEELGFDSEAEALRVCVHGRPGHQDIQHDIAEVYDGSVLDPKRRSCDAVMGQTRQALHAVAPRGLVQPSGRYRGNR